MPSCSKLISLEKWKILTPLQKLPKHVGDLGKIIGAKGFKKMPKGFKKMPKVQKIAQSGHTAYGHFWKCHFWKCRFFIVSPIAEGKCYYWECCILDNVTIWHYGKALRNVLMENALYRLFNLRSIRQMALWNMSMRKILVRWNSHSKNAILGKRHKWHLV